MKSRPLRELAARLAEQRFDLVHVQTPFLAHYTGLALAERLGAGVVETYHTYFEEYLHHYLPFVPAAITRWLARRFSRSQCNAVDAVVVPSSAMLEVLRGYGVAARAEIIPTGIELPLFRGGDGARFRARFGIPPRRPLLLTVSRVAHEKNIGFLLRAMRQVRQAAPEGGAGSGRAAAGCDPIGADGCPRTPAPGSAAPASHPLRGHLLQPARAVPEALLVVTGEGPARKALEAEALRLGLADNTRFIGYLDRRGALLDAYRAADAFVFASRTETQGLVLLEALAVGTPVVSTAVLGTRDVLREGGGCLIAREAEGEFAEKTVAVLRDADLRARLSAEALDYAATWCSGAMARRIADLYRSLTGQGTALRAPPLRSG